MTEGFRTLFLAAGADLGRVAGGAAATTGSAPSAATR